jgi:hypothetical protein
MCGLYFYVVIVLDQIIDTIKNIMEQTNDCKQYTRFRQSCKFSY